VIFCASRWPWREREFKAEPQQRRQPTADRKPARILGGWRWQPAAGHSTLDWIETRIAVSVAVHRAGGRSS